MRKPKPLTLKEKLAKVARNWKGHNIHSDPEGGDEGGDAGELVSAREVRFTDLMLDSKQFNQLVGEQAYNSFFNQGVQPHQPGFTSFSTIWLDDKYRDCTAVIEFGVAATEIELERATIKNISLKPAVGGMSALAFTLVAEFPRDLATLDFERFAGKPVKLSVTFGPVDHMAEKQTELALETKPSDDEDEDNEDDEAETKRQLSEAAAGLAKKRGRKNGAGAGAH